MSEERKFPIDIEVTATGDGAKKVAADLDDVKRKQEEVARGPRITDNSGPTPGGFFNGGGTQQIDTGALQKQRADDATKIAEIEGQISAEQTAQNAILEQKRILAADITTQFALEAEGKKEEAAALAEEIAIRRQAIIFQNQLNVEEAVAMEMAERRVAAERAVVAAKEAEAAVSAELVAAAAAQEALQGKTGINIGKARAEATTLVRELATGNANGRTLSALLGSLGPIVTVAGLAGFAAFEWIKKQTEELEKQSKIRDESSRALREEEKNLSFKATHLRSFTEQEQLRSEILEKISKAQQKQHDLDQEAKVASGGKREELKLQSEEMGNQINMLQHELSLIDSQAEKTAEREESLKRITNELDAQQQALETMDRLEQERSQRGKTDLEVAENAVENERKKALLEIDAAEREKRMTPAVAERNRQNINALAEQKKYDLEHQDRLNKLAAIDKQYKQIDDNEADAGSAIRRGNERYGELQDQIANETDPEKRTELIASLRQEEESIKALNAQYEDLEKKRLRLDAERIALRAQDEAKAKEYNSNTGYQQSENKDKLSQITKKDAEDARNKALQDSTQVGDYIVNQSKKASQGANANSDSSSAAALAALRTAEEHIKKGVNTNSLEALINAQTSFANTAVARFLHLDEQLKKQAAINKAMEEKLKNNRPGAL